MTIDSLETYRQISQKLQMSIVKNFDDIPIDDRTEFQQIGCDITKAFECIRVPVTEEYRNWLFVKKHKEGKCLIRVEREVVEHEVLSKIEMLKFYCGDEVVTIKSVEEFIRRARKATLSVEAEQDAGAMGHVDCPYSVAPEGKFVNKYYATRGHVFVGSGGDSVVLSGGDAVYKFLLEFVVSYIKNFKVKVMYVWGH